MRRVLTGLLLASAALMARADGVGAAMLDWNTFGIVAAVAWGGLLLAFCVWGLVSRRGAEPQRRLGYWGNPPGPLGEVSQKTPRLCASARDKNTWVVLLLFAAIATVEAQKPTNSVPPNLNAPLPQMQQGEGFSLTGLGGVGEISSSWRIENSALQLQLNAPTLSPVQTTVPDADIARGWRVESVSTNAAPFAALPSNAMEHAAWTLRGGRETWFPLELGDFAFPLGTNRVRRLRVLSGGTVETFRPDEPASICAAREFASLIPGYGRFRWADADDGAAKILRWEGVFADRARTDGYDAEIRLFANGDFTTRSNDVETVCRRINPDDWDGDGLANAIDANPTTHDGDFYGTANALPTNANPDAYYWLDVSATGALGVATIRVTCDGPSDLGDHVIVARTNEVCHVPLLAGATYAVESDLPIETSAVSSEYAEIVTNDARHLTVSLPLELALERVQMRGGPESYIAHTTPIDVLPRILGLSGGCCSCVTNEQGFAWACGSDCRCAGSLHLLDGLALWEGYSRVLASELRCPCATEGDDVNGAGVNLAFSDAAVVFENGYTNAPGQVVGRRSTTVTLGGRVVGGDFGGTLTVALSDGGRLVGAGGSLPTNVTVAAGETFTFGVDYEGRAESADVGDIAATATFTENMTGRQLTDTTSLTAARVELTPKHEIEGLENRHVAGVGEVIECYVFPDGALRSISAVGSGSISNDSGTVVYKCPFVAENGFVGLNVLGIDSYVLDFHVVEPEGIVVAEAFEVTYPEAVSNQAGWVGMLLDLYVIPTNVCFGAISAVEVPEYGGGVAPIGYFADNAFSEIWHHTESMGAGQWHELRNDNFFMQDFPRCESGLPDGWCDGQITWRIPTAWGYQEKDDDQYMVKEFGAPFFQIFTMNDQGAFRLAKLEHWVERVPNGTRYRSDNTMESP